MDKISRDRVPGRADRTGRRRGRKKKKSGKQKKGWISTIIVLLMILISIGGPAISFVTTEIKNKIYQINNLVMITGGVVQKSIQVWTRMIRMSL